MTLIYDFLAAVGLAAVFLGTIAGLSLLVFAASDWIERRERRKPVVMSPLPRARSIGGAVNLPPRIAIPTKYRRSRRSTARG